MLTAFSLIVAAQPETITGKVIGIADGDTLTVLDGANQQHKIRLDGIDAPESNQDFGSRSKQSLSDLIFGKKVTITGSNKDRYGRVVGKVKLDGKDINLEQINRGMAWFYRQYAKELSPEDQKLYDETETKARYARRGLWIASSPMPPWKFRAENRTEPNENNPPPVITPGQIIGNSNSKIYHLPDCPDYGKVSERNRVPFTSEGEALAAGYRKARNCP
jgi:endonuclease YncB( thermonuclease family)